MDEELQSAWDELCKGIREPLSSETD